MNILKNSAFQKYLLLTLVLHSLLSLCHAKAPKNDLRVLDWRPKNQMIVKQTTVTKPKFPVIDIHNHLGRNLQDTEKYLREMDEAGVWMCVSLDGRSANDSYKEHLRISQSIAKDRILVFFVPDFSRIDEPDFGKTEAQKLEEAVKMGVKGLKIYKQLGLGHKDKTGKFIKVDDPRIDPIWAKCGELGIPVVIHVSDPVAFFDPIDKFNERYDELAAHPSWSFYGDQYPSKEEILAQRNRVFAKHPKTIFIGAHMGTLPEDLARVGQWLEQYPNLYVDIDARISDIGRQPYTARKFLIKWQDRVMFGTDVLCDASVYRTYYRFLETDDEYINCNRSPASMQGRWRIYGLHLPDKVLEKIYNKNALKIFDMLKKTRQK